jgi:asparagine synthase (glutamine-hydrolysing)
MCGIAGAVSASPTVFDDSLVDALYRSLEHRGPDDEGCATLGEGAVHLGERPDATPSRALLVNRRLAILDVSASGHQPMRSSDGRHVMAYNGEIYNHVELRAELEALGHRFRSNCDTEVLLAAYREWGARALDRLTGMYAFAIWDGSERSMFLARDPFGIKPLFYAMVGGRFCFGSEIGTMLSFPGVRRELDARALWRYMAAGQTDAASETMLEGVRQLPAAHHVTIRADAPDVVEPVRYWRLDLEREAGLGFSDAAERLRELLLDSVALHLRSDVPVAAALSGGLDSSSIVAGARAVKRDDLAIDAFTYVSDDPAASEERWAEAVASASRVPMHRIALGSDELVDDLDRLVRVQGEPFIDTRMYAQFKVFQAARRAGFEVLLEGQGGDEVLAGYVSHAIQHAAAQARAGRVPAAVDMLRVASRFGVGRRRFAREVVRTAAPGLRPRIAEYDRRALDVLDSAWFRERGVDVRDTTEWAAPRDFRRAAEQTLTRDVLPRLLRYGDRNAMAFSLENRVPFLTRSIVEFVFSLPPEYLVAPDGTSKSILRAAMRGIVPDPILERRDKIAFRTPHARWMRSSSPWVERTLAELEATRPGPFDPAAVRGSWRDAASRRRRVGSMLWRTLNVLRWGRIYEVAYA